MTTNDPDVQAWLDAAPQGWVAFPVEDDWPTPNNCRRTAAALGEITPAKYGQILDAYADAEDARFARHGTIREVRHAEEGP